MHGLRVKICSEPAGVAKIFPQSHFSTSDIYHLHPPINKRKKNSKRNRIRALRPPTSGSNDINSPNASLKHCPAGSPTTKQPKGSFLLVSLCLNLVTVNIDIDTQKQKKILKLPFLWLCAFFIQFVQVEYKTGKNNKVQRMMCSRIINAASLQT